MFRVNYKWAIIFMVCIFMLPIVTTENIQGINPLSDIKSTDWFYDDVLNLVNSGVINGYANNTFVPDGNVNVAEFIKMALIAAHETVVIPQNEDVWYRPYVNKAIDNDIIDGDYYSNYLRPITRGEMGNIIDRILKLRYNNAYEYIPQIVDYSYIMDSQKSSTLNVFVAGIITGYNDGTIKANANASRAEAATVIVRMTTDSRRKVPELGVVSGQSDSDNSTTTGIVPVTKAFSVAGIQIGMTKEYMISRLSQPTEILRSTYGFDWYVYASDYSQFKLIGIASNKVVAFYSDKQFDSKYAIQIGTTDTTAVKALTLTEYSNYYYANVDKMSIKFFSEKGVSDGIEGIFVMDDVFVQKKTTLIQDQLDMEKTLLYLTNSTRQTYKSSPLKWSVQAKNAAYKHSKDMALKAYFDHTSIGGVTFKTRMQNEGISASLFAENIGAGLQNAFEMHYALLHSDAHKVNIINPDYDYVGMGIYYEASSKYGYYVTQDYFKLR